MFSKTACVRPYFNQIVITAWICIWHSTPAPPFEALYNAIDLKWKALTRVNISGETSAAIWRIIANYCYLIKMHYGGENGERIGEGVRIAIKI